MNRYLVPLGVFALLAVVLAIGIRRAPEKGIIASPLLGKPAPQFSLPELSQPTHLVRSAELKGRWYLFNVWGTWCGECRAEHETLLQVQRTGVVPLIGLDWKDDERDARARLEQIGNT
jgi:cytochrome c biogenesis protein CcmG, thiol:disulfide interchange protein DsbE